MMHEPVFQDSFEVNVWKRLNSEKESASKKDDFYAGIAASIIKRDAPANSAILSLLIRRLHESQSSGLEQLIDQLVSKSRPNDCMPALTASNVYADINRWDKAEDMVESVKHAQNIPLLGCTRARIAIGTGDTPKAKKELMRARCSDPTFPMFYDLIQQIEPAEGWMYRQNIELMASGKEEIPFGDSTGNNSAQRLYEIYKNWYKGRRDEATEDMIRSEEYNKKNPEYVLASARMSMDERDWHSAQMMYSSLLTKSANCVYIICEAARSYYSGGMYDKALSLYRDAEALDPVSPAVMKGLIKTYSALGMKAEASQCVGEYLDSENADLKAYVSGAKILLSNSMYRDAESVIDKVLLSYPGDPSAYILKSEIEFESGNINAALRTIMNGVDKNPGNADVRLQKAKLLFKTGRTDKAVADLEKAKKADPDNIGVLLLMMEVAISRNKSEEAAKLSNRILELDPGNIEAMNTQSKTSLSSKRREETFASYKDMIVADNRAENFINVLSSMMRDGRYDEIVRMYTEKEREFGRDPVVRRLKGNAEYSMGDYKRASATFASASELDQKDPVIWHSKGMADEAMGDLEHAEEAYNKAILLDMSEPDYWISRSSIQENKKDLAGAVESLNRAIELRPNDIYALVKKGMIFAEMGRFDEASYFLDMALVTDPGNIEVMRIQRDVKTASGKSGEAEELAMRIVRERPSDEEGVGAAVRILLIDGKDDKASGLIETALKAQPKSIPLLLIKKEFCYLKGDHKGVIDACSRILSLQPDNSMIKKDLAEAYAASGDVNTASRMYFDLKHEEPREQAYAESQKPNKAKVQDAVKRYAERVLRRAYISKSTLNDPDLMASLDLDEATSKAIMAYLSDISEYGEITPGTFEFERMEKLSLNAVTRGNCTGLDKDPIISIPCAYVAGGAKDSDEAKLLVAYIYKVMSSGRSAKALDPDLKRIAAATQKGTPVEDIMRNSKVGIYQAKAVRDSL